MLGDHQNSSHTSRSQNISCIYQFPTQYMAIKVIAEDEIHKEILRYLRKIDLYAVPRILDDVNTAGLEGVRSVLRLFWDKALIVVLKLTFQPLLGEEDPTAKDWASFLSDLLIDCIYQNEFSHMTRLMEKKVFMKMKKTYPSHNLTDSRFLLSSTYDVESCVVGTNLLRPG